ncbi:NUDIX hydrolase [Priestia taiwanensis]|uniref:DNA mismatch repair protein MutT n=1 Tax=Priestia taiwanensis TaxID=1347902 RepID=A0A917EPK9_9BACI|nr:NUDIX hydrolase [Priestia taiwanensis]MBM7362499.1 ADP-ribose pyrophosphatase YjhB (NUDIX family) [Priestia taiwanensis]GGE62717.1 DNA mismatch repair protein MutT [Priestia taiwanensis]
MKKWYGAAGLCINEHDEILMVLQGAENEEKRWSIPSGGKEDGESFEECCIRELKEETGLNVTIVKPLHIKKGNTFGIDVEVHYFEVTVTGGTICIQDPDNLIYEVAWKNADAIATLNLSFPEDADYLLNFINTNKSAQSI